jgi:hypothetical protein
MRKEMGRRWNELVTERDLEQAESVLNFHDGLWAFKTR